VRGGVCGFTNAVADAGVCARTRTAMKARRLFQETLKKQVFGVKSAHFWPKNGQNQGFAVTNWLMG
jgi:hypothetical protein